jgi:hypothetical protein
MSVPQGASLACEVIITPPPKATEEYQDLLPPQKPVPHGSGIPIIPQCPGSDPAFNILFSCHANEFMIAQQERGHNSADHDRKLRERILEDCKLFEDFLFFTFLNVESLPM